MDHKKTSQTTSNGSNPRLKNKLWAHSRNDKGDPHLLVEHLSAVARRAQEFLAIPELKTIAYFYRAVA